MSAMFRSFSSFNFRVWFIGALVSNIGSWMQSTAQSWVVLTQLTDNDAGAMGVTMALQFGPPLVLVGWSGWVTDRFDRRRILIVTQVALLALSIGIGTLLLLDVMTLPLMYCFALAMGLVVAFDNPARQAFVSDLVARENASNAVALNAASFNGARMFGPAVAGLLIVAVGTGWVFLINALTYLGMIVALLALRTGELIPRTMDTASTRLADGFRYVARRPDLLVVFAMVFLMGALAMGLVVAFDNPARQAFVSDLVARENASNAVALNAASFNGARMFGPAVAGLLIVAVGTGWVFLINALTYLGMIVALLALRTGELIPRTMDTASTRLADGFRYVARRPDLLVVFAMVFLMGALAMNFPIFASTMALEFGEEADGFGLLSSILAIGSLAGALLAARRARARLRVVIVATGAFGVVTIISSTMPVYWAYAICLVFVGFTTVTTLTTANGYVQTTTDASLRGRVMALYVAILMGGTPLGAPVVGWVASEFGPRTALLVGAAGGLAACAIGLIWVTASGRLHRRDETRFRFELDETRPISIITRAQPIVTPEEFSDQAAETTPIRLVDDEDDDLDDDRVAARR